MALGQTLAAPQRRLVYGVNVAVAVAIATGILVLLLALNGRWRATFDWTRTGQNSLSPRTRQLVRSLGTDVRITALYPVVGKDAAFADQQRRQDSVRDLLRLYEGAGRGRITASVIDPLTDLGQVEQIVTRLRSKTVYKQELEPYSKALEAFPAVNQQLQTLAQAESQRLAAIGAQDPQLSRNEEWHSAGELLRQLTDEGQRAAQQLKTYQQSQQRDYGAIVRGLNTFLERARSRLEALQAWLANKTGTRPRVPADAAAELDKSETRFKPVLTAVTQLQTQMTALKPLRLEELESELKSWGERPPILVETDAEAHVIRFEDVWKTPEAAPGGPNAELEFNGEAAISSAVLRVTQKQKTGVVFVRFGGPARLLMDPNLMMMSQNGMPPPPPYGALNEELERANFVTGEGDVQASPQPPTLPDVVRTVYVVFTPIAPPPQRGRPSMTPPISEEQKQAVLTAVDASGMALFLCGWDRPEASGMPTPGYAWGDYLRQKWGINARTEFLTLAFTPSRQDPTLYTPAGGQFEQATLLVTEAAGGTSPMAVLRFTDQAVSKPLQSAPAAFVQVAPLEIVSGAGTPPGVHVEPIAEVRKTQDAWAVQDVFELVRAIQADKGVKPASKDLRPPFAVGLAATRPDGHRLVVYGSEPFASDQLAQAAQPVFQGGTLRQYAIFPGNTDLFVNTLYWLTGDADRIAVGPRSGDLPRLSRLKPGWPTTLVQAIVVAVLPGLALVAGVFAWFIRRR